MERVHFSGRVPLIYLEILMLRIETEKILKTYTYIQFFREHSSAFNIRFSIFHSNQTSCIKIYTLEVEKTRHQQLNYSLLDCNNKMQRNDK